MWHSLVRHLLLNFSNHFSKITVQVCFFRGDELDSDEADQSAPRQLRRNITHSSHRYSYRSIFVSTIS